VKSHSEFRKAIFVATAYPVLDWRTSRQRSLPHVSFSGPSQLGFRPGAGVRAAYRPPAPSCRGHSFSPTAPHATAQQ